MKSCTQRLLFRAFCLVFAAATSWGSLNVLERSCAARNLPQNSVLACQKKLQNDLTGETQTAVRIACHLLFFTFLWTINIFNFWTVALTNWANCRRHLGLKCFPTWQKCWWRNRCCRRVWQTQVTKGFKCFLKMYFKLLTVGKSCSGGTQARVQWGVWS